MRTQFMKDTDGNIKFERDEDWPWVVVPFSDSERIINTADGRRLTLQQRHRDLRNDKWSRWRNVWSTESGEEMRKLMENFHVFASDAELLDAICLKTDDGAYMEHSH